jgi:hypothetical protein
MYHSPAGQWMAQHAVAARGVSIALACRAFGISERCYRYEPILSDENEEIENWLIALTKARKNWGFGCATGVSETLCMRLSPCSFDGSFIEPFWV